MNFVPLPDLAKAPTALSRLVTAQWEFAADLYAAAIPRGTNAVVSPVSVAIALQMALQGARGATAEQLRTALHLTDDEDAAAGMEELAAAVDGLEREEQALLRMSNSVWVQDRLPLHSAFAGAVEHGFLAELRRVNFANPEDARTAINSAVSQLTSGKILDLLPVASVRSDTRVVLINAIYLQARWVAQFPKDATDTAPFTLSNGEQVCVTTMHQTAQLGYARGTGYQAVMLPYVGGRLAMTILLPDGSLDALEDQLGAVGLAALLRPMSPARVALALPRFQFTTRLRLETPLQRLGVTLAFSDLADFTGITSVEPLKIGFVFHQAHIRVDEEGTEAAAATAVGVVGISAPSFRDPVVVEVDRPFLVTITDVVSGAPLFIARVTEPAATTAAL